MITEDYVSFEIAKLLKEKGFNRYPLFPCYKEDNGEFIDIPTTLDTINYCFIPAPTLQMAMKWLREVHNTCISVDVKIGGKKYYVCISNTESGLSNGVLEDEVWDTYEDACEAAIKYCLENLI